MSLLKKTVSLIAIFSAMPAALAVTARPSVVGTASSRMPTLTGYVSSSSSSSNSSSSLLANAECIEAYTDCLKGSDVCGPNFEECTNNTLFYAKKPLCASTLIQCSASGINSLFGTSNQTAFSNKNSSGEYIYPTAGSVLGQLIEAAHINNRYDTSECVRRYTTCLKRDDVCGYDFELCTSNSEFKKQKLFCESTLARCQDEGLKELFGTTNTAANPSSDSRIGIMISEGAALAAVNAVSTCYKVVDQCFLNACATNPYRCKEGSSVEAAKAAADFSGVETNSLADVTIIDRNNVSGFLRNACLDTIGANKFCYATFIGNGNMPTNSQLQDEVIQNDVYSEAYAARMNDSMRVKIDDLVAQFDKKAKEQCAETIISCAMRTCGEGSGAACYASAFNTSNTVKGVTNPATMEDIKAGCEGVVNNDMACKYAGSTFNTTTGLVMFEEYSLFDKLFTAPDDKTVSNPDPVGAVAQLNSTLSTSYNQAALDSMKKQCQTIATNCVKSMCGADYVNCYRNRTDVYSSLTDSGNSNFDASMNKVGGVLDHTIVLGLCMNTVKSSPVCEEHFKTEAARAKAGKDTTSSWGSATDVRSGWLDAGSFTASEILSTVQDVDADGNLLCTTMQDNGGDTGRCDDASGKYIYPKMIGTGEYEIQQAERAIFKDLVYDLEIEAQAQYNAKLTKQQNMCMSSNSGGIMGSDDMGSTFMWVKLRNNKVPNDYSVSGLKSTQFVASNELYGSFCRIRVSVQSDDPKVQALIKDNPSWANAYFAAGDAFTCGSWIPYEDLQEISQQVGQEARDSAISPQAKNLPWWMAAIGTVGGGIGGAYLGAGIADGAVFSGLTGKSDSKVSDGSSLEKCVSFAEQAINYAESGNYQSARMLGNSAVSMAKDAGLKVDNSVSNAITQLDENKHKENINGVSKLDVYAMETATTNFVNSIDGLRVLCEASDAYAIQNEQDEKNRKLGIGLGSALTGIAGGVLGYTVTNSILQAQMDSAEKAAMEEWMNDIGKHIRCYIGADEVGQYGDVISTSME